MRWASSGATENMSPGRAYTDAEKQAVELQFESLIRLVSNQAEGQRYEPRLADDLPQLVNVLRGEMSIIDSGAYSPSFLD